MVNIILVDKSGDLKLCKYNVDKGDELYKKCKFKKQDNFEKRTTWKTKKNKYDFSSVSLYSRDTGKANTENKYYFPPPVDTPLYFGVCALVANDENDYCIDLSIEAWETFYEELFGGFENLADTAAEDNNEEDGPYGVQTSEIFDINSDGNLDLILGGSYKDESYDYNLTSPTILCGNGS